MSELLPYMLVLVLAVAVIYFVIRISGNAETNDSSSMSVAQRRILIGYLLAVGVLMVYMLISLNSLEFPDTAALPQPIPLPSPSPSQSPSGATAAAKPNPSESPTVQPPALYRIFPQLNTTSPPTVRLALYGKNFKQESRVRFNAVDVSTDFVAADLLIAELQPVHLANVGSLTVDVDNKNGSMSNAMIVPVRRPTVPLNVFGLHPWITRDVQLLLLAVFAGALGSVFHGLKSLADFIGNRTVVASWFLWYIARPFLGMSLALVFYAVLRGGFVVGSPADAKVVNPFGVLAIGALVGMFSDKAAQKLAEVFEIAFRSADQRSGRLDAPVIDRLDPETVSKGTQNPVPIKIVGDRLGKVITVRLNSEDRKPDTVTEKEVTFKLKPEDMTTSGQIKVTVLSSDGGISTAVSLRVSDLAITDPNLPEAQVGTNYAATIAATGGNTPYTWSLVDPPNWLNIDKTSGELKGTPTAADAKDTLVTVKVTDKDGATAVKPVTIKFKAG